MAALFPNTKIIGVDFKEATFQNSHYSLPNMEFRYAVIRDNITGLESFESNSVDAVNNHKDEGLLRRRKSGEI